MQKEQSSIPTTKVARASEFVKTGFKIGVNHVKYYTKKAFDPSTTKDELHELNAVDIYDSLSQLKGSALKVAQMMSMDRNILPKQYSERFQLSQYSAPPLSGPLVVKTFQKYFGKSPSEMYDKFEMNANNAASIGQVHIAYKNEKKLAVKVQYPGIADSISSDLKMVKPFAVRLMGLNEADIDNYMAEVEIKLMEETDYLLEVKRGTEISEACAHIEGLFFPQYYPELSCPKIITMDWLEGKHLKDFMETNPPQEVLDRIGQTLWDFYEFQLHRLRSVHADPHPGNFYFTPDGRVGIIDFGCVKEISEQFYYDYFSLINPETVTNRERSDRLFKKLKFIYDIESAADRDVYSGIFIRMIEMLGRPFHEEYFDFGDDSYFDEVYEYGEQLTRMKEVRDSKHPRGVRDGLYVNRTYYGLYSILNQLRARVKTHSRFMEPDFEQEAAAFM